MEARCAHCQTVAKFVVTYRDGLGVRTQEAACGNCKDARSHREQFDAKRLNAVNVTF